MNQYLKGGVMALGLAAGVQVGLAEAYWVYVGTYTGRNSEGIYLFHWDSRTGDVTSKGLVARTQHPSFLALHPTRPLLYAVNEMGGFRGDQGGALSAFAMDPATGALTFLNQEASLGDGPCHLAVDQTGTQLLAANYGGGSVVSLPLRGDGSLGPASAHVRHQGSSVHPRRQNEPHAHSVNLSPDNRWALVADLGTDRLYVYPFDPVRGVGDVALDNSPKARPGAGPRHFAWHPNGRFGFLIHELDSTLTSYRLESGGRLEEVQTLSTLPEGYEGGNGTAEVVVHPTGRWVYGSNRGHDSIAVFQVDPETGRLTARGHVSTGGRTPRNFAVDPTGTTLWVGNQASDRLRLFRIDGETGDLRDTGQEWEVGSPVCIRFVPVSMPSE
jgi:6-phosphogluconolactonase